MRLIVINSVGPMGSSGLSALLEKYGYVNLPLRKTHISEYVTGKVELKNQKYKRKFVKVLKHMSKQLSFGGSSVLVRDKYKPLKRFEVRNKEINVFKKKKFKSFKDMYFYAIKLSNNSTKYKKKINKISGSIEMAIDSHKYDIRKLEEGYRKNFKDIVFLNCTRNFEGWTNSLCAERFAQPKIQLKYLKFNIYKWKKLYLKYHSNIKNSEGIKINFDDIFVPNFFKTKKNIESKLKLKKISNKKLINSNFDVYGYLISFNEAFKKYDDNNLVLNFMSIKILKFYKQIKFNLFLDIIFVSLFCLLFYFDFLRFKLKNL